MKTNLPAVLAFLALAAPATGAEPRWQHVGTLGQRHLVVVDASAAAHVDHLTKAAKAVCDPAKPCLVAFWLDAAAVPASLPMSAAQQRAMVAQYASNPASGTEEVLRKCPPSPSATEKCLR